MMHKERRMAVVDTTAPELTRKLTETTWCPCNGFRIGAYLFLNDSTSPDGAQEYAICKEETGTIRQLDSATIGWMKPARIAEFIDLVLAGQLDGWSFSGTITNRIETPAEHGRCSHCA
jgi:hypothetical protein